MNKGTKIDSTWIKQLAEQIKKLHEEYELIIVCSGAATQGKNHVQLTPEEKTKYTTVARRQLYAAVGQPVILHNFINAFAPYGITIGQALLTRNTFSEVNRYHNTTAVLQHMVEENIIPLINGNDVITTMELSAGGNDGLAAVVAIAMDADRLVLMSDTDGVYDKNPFTHDDAQQFRVVKDPDVLLRLITNEVNQTGIGGMYAKIEAARLAWYAGIQTVIANGLELSGYPLVMDDDPPGTLFTPPEAPDQSEKQKIRWFLSARNNFGSVVVDDGAEAALKDRKSLLGVGVKEVKGVFRLGDIVSIENSSGQIIACGMVAYDAEEVQQAIATNKKLKKPLVHANKLKLLYV